MSAVELIDVRKHYMLGQTRVEALRGVSFRIEKGEFLAIAGPSGAGKSTILNLIGCIDTPSEGQVFIDGTEVEHLNDTELTRYRRQKLGFIFQSFNLIPVLNVFENIEFPLLLRKSLSRSALSELTARLGLRVSTRDEQRISSLLRNKLEAFRWYRQAQAVYAQKAGTQSGYKEVRELAQKAMELDPHYVVADYYDAYIIRNLFVDRAPSDVWPDVERRMLNIEQRDDTFGQALDQLGGYLLIYQRDWIGAYRLWNRGLLYCSEQERHFRQAFYYRIHGWFDEARIHQELSEQSKPAFIEIERDHS